MLYEERGKCLWICVNFMRDTNCPQTIIKSSSHLRLSHILNFLRKPLLHSHVRFCTFVCPSIIFILKAWSYVGITMREKPSTSLEWIWPIASPSCIFSITLYLSSVAGLWFIACLYSVSCADICPVPESDLFLFLPEVWLSLPLSVNSVPKDGFCSVLNEKQRKSYMEKKWILYRNFSRFFTRD